MEENISVHVLYCTEMDRVEWAARARFQHAQRTVLLDGQPDNKWTGDIRLNKQLKDRAGHGVKSSELPAVPESMGNHHGRDLQWTRTAYHRTHR
jgi:hypothetical protein